MSRTVSIPRSLLVGGPLDGETISSGQNANFLWVQVSSKGAARCYADPARGRHLYRLVHKIRPYKYLYAGHTHAICPQCSGYTEITQGSGDSTHSNCVFCGEVLEA